MRRFLGELVAAPGGGSDEMAVIAVCIGGLFITALATLIGLELFVVVCRGVAFLPGDFANAAAILFGAAGGVLSALACAMGLKAKCGG